MANKIIYINGFMACGKSTIGPILANTLGWNYYDLDKVIEKSVGKTIVDIFNDEGEEFFRQKESEALQKLSKEDKVVISLGGGTSSYGDNLKTIKSTGTVVYLKVSADILFKRLRNKKDRPLVNGQAAGPGKEELKERIIRLLTLRGPYYEQADFIINTDNYSLGLTIDKIAKYISKNYEED